VKRVLVADDDVDVCTLLRMVLEPLCAVTTVHDAESALALLAADARFDAIISDFMLPGLDGLEFVARIRSDESDEEEARVPILMISGHGALGVGERARAAGVDAFLDKPFTLAQLRATMRALLGSQPRYA